MLQLPNIVQLLHWTKIIPKRWILYSPATRGEPKYRRWSEADRNRNDLTKETRKENGILAQNVNCRQIDGKFRKFMLQNEIKISTSADGGPRSLFAHI